MYTSIYDPDLPEYALCLVSVEDCYKPNYSTLDYYKDIIKDLTVEEIDNIMHPIALSRLKEEYLDTHNRLEHMAPSEMFTLCDHNHLPKRFLRLKN